MGKKRKHEKRKEAYKKAVEHKMKSAAELVDGYREAYELADDRVRKLNMRNKRIVNRKLFTVVGGTLLQSILLLAIVALVFFPFKSYFSDVINEYFNQTKPDFTQSELSDEFLGSTNETHGVYFTDVRQPEKGDYYAKISIDGVDSKIYYGMSDSALLEGVCQYSKTSLPGFNKPIMLYGYSNTHFKCVENIKMGDIIAIITNYGVYKYKVSNVQVIYDNNEALPYNLEDEKEKLILCTDYPFDTYKLDSNETYCIIADKVSGPEIAY